MTNFVDGVCQQASTRSADTREMCWDYHSHLNPEPSGSMGYAITPNLV